MTTIHKKIWPEYFEQITSGKKKVELRLADFEVNEGDTLVLEEWDKDKKEYTGRKIEVTVTYTLKTKSQPFWRKEEVNKYGFQIIQFEPKRKRGKLTPERITFWIYKGFTSLRLIIPVFIISLLIFELLHKVTAPSGFTFHQAEVTAIMTKMIYLLLSITAFNASFFPIAIGIISKERRAQVVTALFSNLVKYTTYPFIIAILIAIILFIKEIELVDTLPFSFFLLSIYLTINALYTTIKSAEHLVNAAWNTKIEL